MSLKLSVAPGFYVPALIQLSLLAPTTLVGVLSFTALPFILFNRLVIYLAVPCFVISLYMTYLFVS